MNEGMADSANAQTASVSRPVQLPLGVQLPDAASFRAYHAGPNAEARDVARTVASGTDARAFLHGGPGAGKSHLLQAACREAADAGRRAAYLPLAELSGHGPALLDGLAEMDLICLDDVAAIAGKRDWEEALVGLIDSRYAAGRGLLVADRAPPADLAVTLADLRSRLGWAAVYALRELDDVDKRALLVQRATERGLKLPEDVAAYLMRRRGRDVPGLMAMLDELDRASLAAKRRLTIPFVKQVLETDA